MSYRAPHTPIVFKEMRKALGPIAGGKGESFTVKVPLPSRDLSPNGRCHWAKKARAVKAARTTAWALAVEAQIQVQPNNQQWKRARVSAVWWLKDRRGMDADRDNRIASLKATIDGLVDAKVIANDRGVEWGAVETGGVDAADPGVVLRVEAIP